MFPLSFGCVGIFAAEAKNCGCDQSDCRVGVETVLAVEIGGIAVVFEIFLLAVDHIVARAEKGADLIGRIGVFTDDSELRIELFRLELFVLFDEFVGDFEIFQTIFTGVVKGESCADFIFEMHRRVERRIDEYALETSEELSEQSAHRRTDDDGVGAERRSEALKLGHG